MRSVFAFPGEIVSLLKSAESRRLRTNVIFAAAYILLGALGQSVEASKSLYDYPTLDVLVVSYIVILLVPARHWIENHASSVGLFTVLAWLVATTTALFLAEETISLFSGTPIPSFRVLGFPADALAVAFNLASYSLVISAIGQYRSSLKLLMQERNRLEQLRTNLGEKMAQISNDYSRRVKGVIEPVLLELTTALSKKNANAMVQNSRNALDQVVIPLLRQVEMQNPSAGNWVPEAMPTNKLRLKLSDLRNYKYQLGKSVSPLLTTIYAAATLLGAFNYLLGSRGILAGCITLLVSFILQAGLVYGLASRRLNAWVAALSILGYAAVTAAISMALGALVLASWHLDVLLFLWLGLFLVISATGIFQFCVNISDQHLVAVATASSQYVQLLKRQETDIRQLQKRISSAVHSDIQGKLRSVLLRVKNRELDADTSAAIGLDLEHIASVLEHLGTNSKTSFQEEMDGLSQFWDGICNMNLQASEEALATLQNDSVLAESAVDVLNEAVANAVKHAAATKVEIRVALQDSNILLSVVNDANPTPIAPASSGYGSAMLDELCASWSVTKLGSTTQFSATLLGA